MAEFRIRNMSEDLRRRLRIRAAETDTTLNELILRLLDEALKAGKGRA
jgi:plasmid stability protein